MRTRHGMGTTALIALSIGLGGSSLALLGAFLFFGPFELLPLGLGTRAALLVDALLCLVFFTQHSGMLRRSFRAVLARLVPERCHSALYSVASGATLLILLAFWQRSGVTLLSLSGAAWWGVRLLFVMAVVGFGAAVLALREFDPFGVRPLAARPGAGPPRATPLTIRGPYRWVRHPLYGLSIVLLWATPDLTLDRGLFALLGTVWILVGTRLEERDLIADFGDSYRDYQRRVPMLIPGLRGPRR